MCFIAQIIDMSFWQHATTKAYQQLHQKSIIAASRFCMIKVFNFSITKVFNNGKMFTLEKGIYTRLKV